MPTKQPVLQQVQDLLQQRFAKSMFANTEVLTNSVWKTVLKPLDRKSKDLRVAWPLLNSVQKR